jgi:hypothetical protein
MGKISYFQQHSYIGRVWSKVGHILHTHQPNVSLKKEATSKRDRFGGLFFARAQPASQTLRPLILRFRNKPHPRQTGKVQYQIPK